MKEHTTFIQIGKSRLIPIPFWAWLAITRAKIKYLAVKIWILRRLGIIYDFERGLTPRALDALPESECPYCHEKFTGTYGDHVLQKAERQ